MRCGTCPNAAAAPATVSGEPRINQPLGNREGDAMATTREPGDLPSIVVMHGHIGRGAPVGTRDRLKFRAMAGLWFVVTVTLP